MSQRPTLSLEYNADRAIDGAMLQLLYPLRSVLEFDRLHLNQNRLTQAYLTVFRRQAKRLFHIKLLRPGRQVGGPHGRRRPGGSFGRLFKSVGITLTPGLVSAATVEPDS